LFSLETRLQPVLDQFMEANELYIGKCT